MAPRWYRIEHRTGDDVASLGRVADLTPHPASLTPFVSRLLLDGRTGVVVLVDEATGVEVARHELRRGPLRGPTAGRTALAPPNGAGAGALRPRAVPPMSPLLGD
jgi:hypothetical protein